MEKTGISNLEDLGYDPFFESGRKEAGLERFSVARVIFESRGAYRVINEKGEFLAKITGKQIFNASSREDFPAVGDWVAIEELDSEKAVIRAILPRKTIIKRKSGDKDRAGDKDKIQVIGTNIDVAFAVESIGRDYNLNRLERYFAIAKDGGAQPAIIINKIDLASKEDIDLKLAELRQRFGDVAILATSTVNQDGLDELKKYITYGKTYCFLGSSGVGKSSLINKLLGESGSIKTGDISESSGRGQHITTSREMYFLEDGPVKSPNGDHGVKPRGGNAALRGAGGILIDNPGMREVGLADANAGIDNLFDEITALAKDCKYADCAHIQEPDCAVLAALESGKLDKQKYENYINLKKEARYYQMSKTQKREKDRQFGKFMKNWKKQKKKFN